MPKKEIHLTRTTLLAIGAALLFVILLGVWLTNRFQDQSTRPQEDELAQKAAEIGVEAFFTLDYQQGMHSWMDGVCAVSTPSGCEIIQEIYGPPLWKAIEAQKMQTTCEATTRELVDEVQQEQSTVQTWKLSVILSQPFPGQSNTQTVYAEVLGVDHEDWKFERVLTDQEAEIYQGTGE